jgi:uncharacterized lipoprotein YddW (UPF0748 family)
MDRVAVALSFLLTACSQAHATLPPKLPREFRGVWIATVSNIDWPSKKGLSTQKQQAELLSILDKCVDLKLNAVIFQVRPMADALYASKLEPWSEFLTGAIGKPPSPSYDPLEFAVREAHARGLELHAWFNPYRARHPSAKSSAPEDHLTKRRPDLAKTYGTHSWLNPTHPEVQEHSLSVILDVVRRYDIDGIHIDDYFYPYKEKDAAGKIIPFPDDDTWDEYRKTGGALSRDDWRRAAVNRFVERMYREVKKTKPLVKVGISPFGIWRPGHPPGIAGLDQYAELYADAKLWWNEGWCDYFSPQLYWPIRQEKQSYPKLLEWWAAENKRGRHLWPGNYTSRVTVKEKGWPATEINEQIKTTRDQKGASGNVHFSMKALLGNTGGVADALKAVYRERALVPAVTWSNSKPPPAPRAQWRTGDKKALEIQRGDAIRWFVVRTRNKDVWTVHIEAADSGGVGDGATAVLLRDRVDEVVVTAIDRHGHEGPEARLR